MRRIAILAATIVAAGCGGTKASESTDVLAGSHRLYESGDWAVVAKGARAVAAHRDGDRWVADRSGRVRIRILGPEPGTRAPRRPQVAIEMTASQQLAESALWVDGKELLEKGGGSPTRGTIYGAPDAPLARGRHVAVAYARTASSATAVAWTFDV